MNEEIKYLDYEGLQDFKQRLDLQLQNAINTVNESISQLENSKADIDDISHEAIIEDANGHEYVEIAGIKWATCNVGADNPDDEGLYFAWGETTGYTSEQVGTDKNFSWEDYELTEDDGTTMTKYNSTDEKIILELTDDAASVNMGGSWRMPTTEELQALSEAVNTEWTNNYNDTGVSGLVLTDKTDSSKVLFFPACGSAGFGSVYSVGSGCCYWSSSLSADDGDSSAYYLHFRNGDVDWQCGGYRFGGFSVRGVLGTIETKVQGTTITEAEREYWNGKANSIDITQSDWNQNDNTKADYIKNKPDLSLKANVSDLEDVQQDIEEIQQTIEDNERVVSTALNDLSTNKQDTLVSGTNIKTVNGSSIIGSGDVAIKSYHTLNNSWLTNSTTQTFCSTIAADSSAEAGMTYSGKIECSDLPANMVQGEVVVQIISDDESNEKNIHLVLTSVNTAPYRWEYSYVKVNGVYVASGWIGYQPEITSTNKLDYSLLSNTPNISEKANQSDLEALEQIVEDNEEVIATALNDLEERKADLSDLTSFVEKSSISLVNITTNTSSSCSITGNDNSGKQQLIIYTNGTGSDYLVTVPTTYSTPNGQTIELVCKTGGYCEVSYININGTIYARGL